MQPLLVLPLRKAWSDEAREAAAEARRTGLKAKGKVSAENTVRQWTQEYRINTPEELMAHAAANQAVLEETGRRAADAHGAEMKTSGAKTRESLDKKLERKKPHEVTDATRIGLKVKTPDHADRIVDYLAQHFETADEGWRHEPTGYFDRTAKVRFPNGQTGEVQLWPPGLQEAKSSEGGGGHKMYKEWRAETDPAKQKAIESKMQKLYADTKAKLPPEWKKTLTT